MMTRRELLTSVAAGLAAGASFPRVSMARAAAATGPGPRAGHVLVDHDARGGVCLLGGDRVPAGALLEQPWSWDGKAWTTSAPAPDGPGARTLPAAAYDPTRRVALMFGGIGLVPGSRYGDLWELDATGRWTDRTSSGPGPRDHHAAVFDSARGRFVVYGGLDGDWKTNTDVWEWDGQVWHRLRVKEGPAAVYHHAMAYDAGRRRTVLFGGTSGVDRQKRPETWEWDGAAWSAVATAGPAPRSSHRMAYDVERGTTVLFGGSPKGDTWLWDGRAWRSATPSRSPAPRQVSAMTYDTRRKRVVLYGGTGTAGDLSDLWEWDGADWQLSI